MAKKFSELEKKLSPARRAKVKARAKELIEQEVAAEGIKDLCGIQECENCSGDVDPHGDNCTTRKLTFKDQKVYAHKKCPESDLHRYRL